VCVCVRGRRGKKKKKRNRTLYSKSLLKSADDVWWSKSWQWVGRKKM